MYYYWRFFRPACYSTDAYYFLFDIKCKCSCRFNIPDPPDNLKVNINQDADTNQRIKDDLKKFRKEYIKPVQFRQDINSRTWFLPPSKTL